MSDISLVKFQQGEQANLPSYKNGAVSVTTDTHNTYVDTPVGRRLVGTASEAFLNWGGKSLSANFSPIDAALEGSLGANRFAFLSPNRVKLEYSRDSGETWIEIKNDIQKKNLFIPASIQGRFYIGNRMDTGLDRSGDLARVTIKTSGTDYNGGSSATIYSKLNKFIIYISTGDYKSCWMDIDIRLQANIDSEIDEWKQLIYHETILGWGGFNVINTPSFTTYGYSPSSHYGEIRFTCGADQAYSDTYGGLAIVNIGGYGGMGWSTPSNFARHGHLYNWDLDQNATFPASVKATSFEGSASSIVWNEF